MWETVVQAVINGLLIGGIYALVSIGVTLIFGVVKIVNFAQGEFVMIGMYISFFLANQFGIDPLLSLFVSMPVLFVIGVLVQHFLIRRVLGPLSHRPHILFGRSPSRRRALYPGSEADRLCRGDGAERRALGLPARHRSRQGDARSGSEP